MNQTPKDEEFEFLEKSNKFYKDELTTAVKFLKDAREKTSEPTWDAFIKKHAYLLEQRP